MFVYSWHEFAYAHYVFGLLVKLVNIFYLFLFVFLCNDEILQFICLYSIFYFNGVVGTRCVFFMISAVTVVMLQLLAAYAFTSRGVFSHVKQ